MLSVGGIRFEDGIGGGGQVSAQDAVHMAAAWLDVEKPWLALAGPFLSFQEKHLLVGEP